MNEAPHAATFAEAANRIVAETEKAIVGKHGTVVRAVLSLLCEGHVLLEDIPGVGKTTLAKALAASIGGEFRRIQFTPDLLPADITGASIYDQRSSEFEFRPGPIFGNVVLADEINRATPKTQSALLEAMDEFQVTVDGVTRDLPDPMFVVATQNSVEMTGTYPLPEAQLDRFFMRLGLGYPGREEEADILSRQKTEHPLNSLKPVVELSEVVKMRQAVREVYVHDSVRDYIVDIVRATRDSNQLLMGASPRGSLHLMRASQAMAAISGSGFVRPDDVKAVAAAVLAHRVMPRADVRLRGQGAEGVIEHILDTVTAPVPVG